MKFLIVGLTGQNSQFLKVKEEAEKRGHELKGCFVSDLYINTDSNSFEVRLKNNDLIESFDVVYLWTLGKRRYEWQVAVNHLSEIHNTKFINSAFADMRGVYSSNSMLVQYLTQSRVSLPFPKTSLFYNKKGLVEFVDQYNFPVILKFANSRKGEDIFKLDSKDELFEKVLELQKSKEALVLREFIPNDGDIRVFTVGYRAIGAMKRTPKKGDFKSNISQGGSGEKFDLEQTPGVCELAEKVSEAIKIEIAGVDIIINKETGEHYILEVNPGPQFKGLEKYTNINVAEKIVEYMIKIAD